MFLLHKAGLVGLLVASIFTPLLAAPSVNAPTHAIDARAPETYDELSAPVVEARNTPKRASPFRGLQRRGMAASQARYMMLTARKSDLELQMQFIQQSRAALANTVAALVAARLTAPADKQAEIDARIRAIQETDKRLELELKRIDTQRDAVQTEIDAVRKIIGKNIESTFKTIG